QDFLDLRRVDVEATGDDHLLDAGDDTQEAIFLHDGHVAGLEPVLEERLLVLRHVNVAAEYLRATDQQLASLAVRHGAGEVLRISDPNLGARERDADIACARVFRNWVRGGNRGGLGQAVALDDGATRAPLPLVGDGHGQWGSAGERIL